MLPNKRVANLGCNIVDLPYVLVEIDTNYTSSANQQTIQSNSPHIKNQCQFFVPIDGVCSSTNIDAGFVSIHKIRKNQSSIDFPSYDYLQYLSFRILLPNGDTLQFEEEEYTLPYGPNEALNISLFLEVSER